MSQMIAQGKKRILLRFADLLHRSRDRAFAADFGRALECADAHGKGKTAERIEQAKQRGEQQNPDGEFLFPYAVSQHTRCGE